MRSILLTGIKKMDVFTVPDPIIVNDTDVKIKMKVVGVCGSDIHYFINGKIGNQVVDFPFTLGHEGAGEVVETGTAVTRVRPGDRIAIEPAVPCQECEQCLSGRENTCHRLRFLGCPGQAEGCLSEYLVMPESCCFPVPRQVSYDEAAISEPLAIGVYSVKQALAEKKFKTGILGFGPIGMSVMIAALDRGADKVYVTDKIDARSARAIGTGAAWSGNPDKDDVVGEILRREPYGLNVIFECCGSQEAMDQAVDLARPGGKIIIVGIPEFDNWSFSADKIRRKEISLINIRRQNHALQETLEILNSGKTGIKSMVTHRFPFEKTLDAFNLVAGYKDGVMKAMIDI